MISAYPAWNAATLDLFFGRITHEFGKPGAFPSKVQQDLVAQRVLAACDFDPETLPAWPSYVGGSASEVSGFRCEM